MNSVRKIRQCLGMTQDALGKEIGATQSNVAHYENGQGIPAAKAKRLQELAKRHGYVFTLDDIYADDIDPSKLTVRTPRRRSTDPKPKEILKASS